jgi:Oligosaccharyl transferase STT3, N-terminal
VLTRTQREWTGRILCAASVLLAVSAVAVLLAGGYSFRIGPFRLASHNPIRDLIVAAIAAVAGVRLWGRDHVEAAAARFIVFVERRAVWAAAIASVAVFIVGASAGTRCACAADAYGYVSQAELWANGILHVPEPLTTVVPWAMPEWTLSPLGYRPATYPGAIVPTYPPGLPMTMAAALTISRSRDAVFLVVPILGAATVWAAFLLGRQLDTSIVGLVAALLTASSPTFLFQLIQPMSDVPVAAWWLLAAASLFRRPTPAAAFLAGLGCSAAVLTRPNLAALTLVFLPFLESRTSLLRFVAGALPGPIAVALIQSSLYGSPLASGYGRLRDIFAIANVGPNLNLYATWFWQSHGPFIFVGALSIVVWMIGRDSILPRMRRLIVFALAFDATLFLSYLLYSPFDNWTYTRFLLPGIPLLVLLGVWTLFAFARVLRSPAAQVVALGVLVYVGLSWAGYAVHERMFRTKEAESRYIAVGKYIGSSSPPQTLVISMQHSGSIRYYGNRKTVRYDWMNGRTLTDAIDWMQSTNRSALIVLEDWEEPRFRTRFQGQAWGSLDWPPRAEFESSPRVRVYDPLDRALFMERGAMLTRRIPVP